MPLGSFAAGVTEKRRSQTVTLLSHGHFQADQILLAITGHPPYRVTNARVPAHGFACLKEIAQRQTKTRIKIAHRDFEMQQPHHVTAARACGFHKSVQYQICPRRRALTANAMSFPIGCGRPVRRASRFATPSRACHLAFRQKNGSHFAAAQASPFSYLLPGSSLFLSMSGARIMRSGKVHV